MDSLKEDGAEPEVVYEDGSLVAVFKPPRMHCAPGLGAGDLCSWTFARYPETRLEAGDRGSPGSAEVRSLRRRAAEGGLLHRLDYETSGIVLFARTADAFASVLDQQDRGVFRKEYIARSTPSRNDGPRGSLPPRGCPDPVDAGEWEAARLAQDPVALSALVEAARAGRPGRPPQVRCAFRPYGPRGARVACLEPAGGADPQPSSSLGLARPAVYRSELLAASVAPGPGGPECVELWVGLERGFRHQIRAMLAWVGLPILGDPLYGGGEDSRLRLYAVGLELEHPVSGNALRIKLG